MAFVGRQRNIKRIESIATRLEANKDALFGFCRSAEGRSSGAYGETVNVSALITAAGALHQMTSRSANRLTLWQRLTENTSSLASWLADSPFVPVLGSPSLQSGILLLQDPHSAGDSPPVERSELAKLGLIASAFTGGLLRLSMPTIAFSLHQMSTIARALHQLESCKHRKPRPAEIYPCFHTEITQQATT